MRGRAGCDREAPPRRRRGLSFAPPADKRTLLRRVYYDLIGLPPRFEDIRAFERDSSPKAFAKIVEQLLASPRYGERWGRHWLDVAGYSDSTGDAGDSPREVTYKYRDYVINAFNKNKPFDQFTVEQLAGDLLPPPSPPSKGGGQGGRYLNLLVPDRKLGGWPGLDRREAPANCR